MAEVVELITTPMQWYTDKINNQQPFSLSRWGDGEWRSVLAENDKCWAKLAGISGAWRKGKTNKSGHAFPPEMGKDMRKLLTDRPGHYLALANRYGNPDSKEPQISLARWIKQWLVVHQLSDLRWTHADTIVKAFYMFKFDDFFNALRGQNMIMVGPRHLKRQKIFKLQQFVEVPRRNAYKNRVNAVAHVTKALERTKKPTVVSISMGPAAALVVEDLHKVFGKKHTILDLGSIWDPFVGELSRSYMKKPELQDYIQKLKELP